MISRKTYIFIQLPLQKSVTFKEPPAEAPNAMAAGISPEMAGMASLGRRGRRMSTDLYKVRSSVRPSRSLPLPAALGTLSELEVTSLYLIKLLSM